MAKKNNIWNSDSKPGLISKILGPIKILLTLHLRLAGKELKKDIRRFISGIVAMIFGLLFLLSFFILLNFLIVLFLKEIINLSTFYSVLIITAFNLLLSIIFFAAGNASLKKPFFSETKKAFKQTFKDFK